MGEGRELMTSSARISRFTCGAGKRWAPAQSRAPGDRGDERDRVSSESLSDRAGRSRLAECPRDLATSPRLARRDFPGGCVHPALESAGRGEVDGHASEVLKLTREVPAKAFADLADKGRRRARTGTAAAAFDAMFRARRSRSWKLKRNDARRTAGICGFAPGDAAHAKPGFKQRVGGSNHTCSLTHVDAGHEHTVARLAQAGKVRRRSVAALFPARKSRARTPAPEPACYSTH